jgi:hypothetical protein
MLHALKGKKPWWEELIAETQSAESAGNTLRRG